MIILFEFVPIMPLSLPPFTLSFESKNLFGDFFDNISKKRTKNTMNCA